jgi:PAS domain S-box-containing protein
MTWRLIIKTTESKVGKGRKKVLKVGEENPRLLESERSLQATLCASPFGIGRITNSVVDWVNEPICNITGYSVEELKGKSSRILFESDEEHERIGKILHQDGQAEHRVLKKDGSIRNVFVRVSPIDSHSYIFTMTDITSRKHAEKALRFMQLAVDKAFDNIFWVGKKGEILYANEAACRITGYTSDELLSMTIFDINPYLTFEEREKRWAKRKKVGTVFLQDRYRSKDGRIFPVEVSSNLMEYDGDEHSCLIFRDVSERKQT